MKDSTSEHSGNNAAKTQAPSSSKTLALPGIAPLPILGMLLIRFGVRFLKTCSYMGIHLCRSSTIK